MKIYLFVMTCFLSLIFFNCGGSSDDSTSVAYNWQEYASNPIIDSEWDTAYDDLLINDPCVIKEGSTYRMWFSQGTGLGVNHVKIYHGTSSDGINWILDRSTILLESNSDTEATLLSGPLSTNVTGTYKLVGEEQGHLYNFKPAFKLEGQDWFLWYDTPASNYRISATRGTAGSESWIGNGGTKVDGTYSPVDSATGTITIISDWDSEKIETPMVVHDGTEYHMYYSGFKIGDGPGKYQIGHATSPDGLIWTKDFAYNPVVAYHDNPNNWGYYLVAEPAVIYENNTFYLYYTSLKYRGPAYASTDFAAMQGICLSTSPDGSDFTFQQAVLTQSTNYPVSGNYVGYSTPYIMKDSDNKYHLFYDVAAYLTSSDWRQVALAHAVSDDMLNFMEIEHDIFVYDQNDWKHREVRSPSVIEEDGYFKMWFAGNNDLFFQPGFIFAIGYATLQK
jgi:hypothetical protein